LTRLIHRCPAFNLQKERFMTIIVVVRSHPFKVETFQKSKAVWIASGEYRGEMIAGRGQSEGEAIKRWREAAIDRGG
jgi:hypothetical protein